MEREAVNLALSYLPQHLSREIERLAAARCGGVRMIREIRVREGGRCSVLLGDEALPLFSKVREEDMRNMVTRLSDGALYAHRDSICEGYLSLGRGIRVGISGVARYEGERLVGVGSFSSAVFRIPTGECSFANDIYEAFCQRTRHGMLVYSPPGVGKTTALRSLVGSLGRKTRPRRVVVVDERHEFSALDYSDAEVDILSGYKKSTGVEIATRTMSPDVIVLDEIGSGEVGSLLLAVRCGVPIVASAHASSLEEIRARRSLLPLLECGAFDCFVGIEKERNKYSIRVEGL